MFDLTTKDFVMKLLERIGVLVDRVIGERRTVEYKGPMEFRNWTLNPDAAEEKLSLGVTVSKVTYVTIYDAWWMPSTRHSVYLVTAFAPERIKSQLDARLFEPQVYPLLCNFFLRHSKYPHLYAIHAFFDRIRPTYPSLRCDVEL